MISTETTGTLRIVTLDRPDRRNALTTEGLAELESVVVNTTEPVIYIHGAGPAFCAGADLHVIESLTEEQAATFSRQGQTALDTIEDTDNVVVVGVDGAARGGGVELALAADLRIATPSATFAEPGVEIGIFGAWGGTRRLPEAVGTSHAMDLSLSGRTISAEEALNIGLVSRISTDPRDVAESVAENDPEALTTLKHLLRNRADREVQQAREAERFADLVGGGRE